MQANSQPLLRAPIGARKRAGEARPASPALQFPKTIRKREVEELRERVKVLERIAPDGRDTKRLSDEIDKLRDE